MNFYSKHIESLRKNMKALFEVFYDEVMFHWMNDLETSFRQIKSYSTKYVTLNLPNTNHPIFFFGGSFFWA